ncbi:hypothetical protein [Salinicoccus albus]|uniref:hypothetical protein n=1 Tax=Salinicoccus albus TaxID=418756 RepID=UPI00036A8A26|nr:hypothetical protein [Salinicoccus albus]
MAIIVKVKDSTNDETDFKFIRNDKGLESVKAMYIDQEFSGGNNRKFIQFIYPGHTETFTQFMIHYKRR